MNIEDKRIKLWDCFYEDCITGTMDLKCLITTLVDYIPDNLLDEHLQDYKENR